MILGTEIFQFAQTLKDIRVMALLVEGYNQEKRQKMDLSTIDQFFPELFSHTPSPH